MEINYKPMIADKLLTKKLASKGAVLIEGAARQPRQSNAPKAYCIWMIRHASSQTFNWQR